MTAKAIFRIKKIKTFGQLKACEGHNNRTRETPNADPEKSKLNRNLLKHEKGLIEQFKEKTEGQTIRKNAVLAVEILLSASPEFFKTGDAEKDKKNLNDWVKSQQDFLKREFKDNVLLSVLHLDETTPHIQAVVICFNASGKLDTRSTFGGADKLKQWQDKAAESVKHLGIVRGLKGSKATHTDIKKYYAELNKPTQDLPDLPSNLGALIPGTQAHQQRQTIEQKRAKLFKHYQTKAKSVDRLKREKQQAEKTAQQATERLEAITKDPDYKAFKREALKGAGLDLQHNKQQQAQIKTIEDLKAKNSELSETVEILGSWLDPSAPPALSKAWERMTPAERTAYLIAMEQWRKKEDQKAVQRDKVRPK